MEVRQLQIFHVLAKELNFTRTAEKVHTVQSNVTAQIKSLEEELGAPLFDRLGRRVILTEAGRRFQPFARQALTAMEQGQRAIRPDAEPCGPLRIAAPESVLTYRLPEVLRAFRRRFPSVELAFDPYIDAALAAKLETGEFDLAIRLTDELQPSSIESVRLRTERIFLFAEPGHPLAAKTTVKPADLAGESLLLTESGCSYRRKLDSALAMQNIRPGNVTEFSSVEAIKQCVAAGMGVGLLAAMALAREMRHNQFKLLHWAGPSLDISSCVAWHKDKWISPAMRAFIELCKDKLME